MVTAKQLDDLKSKVDTKREQLRKMETDLGALETDLTSKVCGFMADYGIDSPAKSSPAKKPKARKPKVGTVRSNAKAKAVITKMIGKKKMVEIKKPEKEQIAEQAGCTLEAVNQTLKIEFVGYPIGKGRKGKFGLK